jgi:arylsulfatase A-like enzyme
MPANARGKRSQAMTLNIDLQPTVLELVGLTNGSAAHGRSASPHLKDPKADGRSLWFFEHRFPNNGWIPSSEGVRTRRWKYTRYTDVAAPFEELYDLRNNPVQTVNLIGNPEYRRQREALTRHCQTWRRALTTWKPETTWSEPVTQADLDRDGLI